MMAEENENNYVNSLSEQSPAQDGLVTANVAELQAAIEGNLQQAATEVAGQVHQSASELFNEMYQLGEAEKEFGPSGAWKEFEENKQEIKENLQELGQAIDQQTKELDPQAQARSEMEKQDLNDIKRELHAISESLQQTQELLSKVVEHSCQNVVNSFSKGTEFIQGRHEQIRSRTIQERLEAQLNMMEKEIQICLKDQKNVPQEMHPKLLEMQEAGTVFMKKMKEFQGLENNPFAVQTDYQKILLNEVIRNVKNKANEVRQSIADFPMMMHQAMKDKSLDLLQQVCHKAVTVFDKAIQFLDRQRGNVLELASDTKLDRRADPEKIFLAHMQNAVLHDPALSEKELRLKVCMSLHNAGYNERKIKECFARSPAFKNLSLKERTAQINQIIKEKDKSQEIAYSR